MKSLRKMRGFTPYILVVLLNAITDLGHKIVIQNTVFKVFSGTEQIALTATVNALLLLPFILLFTPAACIADRFAKSRVIRISAAAAIPLAVLIVIFYHAGLFWPAFLMTFLLAVQSAFYSPAKYGYIKEMTGQEGLAQANAAVQAVTIVAILLGAVIFSVFFEAFLPETMPGSPHEILRAIAPCGYILVAGTVLETILAFRLPEIRPGDRQVSIDSVKYLRGGYLRDNMKLLKEKQVIWLSIIGLTIFWSVNQVLLATFGAYLKDVAGETNTVVTQGMLALGGLGIIVGSVMAGRVSRNFIETGTIPLGAMGMTVCLFLLPNIESRALLSALLFGYGVCGGLLVVPLNALIQFSARDREMGKILAGNNFLQNIGMLVFLGLTLAMSLAGIGSVPLFYILAAVALGGTIYTLGKLPQSLLRYLLYILFSQRYRLSVSGLNHLPADGGVLLLGNHVSWIDWAVLHLAVPRRLRFVMERSIYERWYLKWLLRRLGMIPISSRGSRQALRDVEAALKAGECVVIFPEGAISRNGQLGEFKRGFEIPARESGCAIVPFYLRGLWGSLFSFAGPRLRETSRIRSIRDVTVCFGPPMAAAAQAPEVKTAVSRLSIAAWKEYSETFDPLHMAWLRTAKRYPGRRAVADSTGSDMSHRRLLSSCILASRMLRKRTVGQKNVGVLLPASVGGVIANMSLLMLGKTVVNLNYTSGADTLPGIFERAHIGTVVTSEAFLARLRGRGIDLSGILQDREVFFMETLRSGIGKGAFIAAMIASQVLPAIVLRLLFFQRVCLEDTAAILFSSGSEGSPKGVMLTHENIMGNIKQVASLFNARDHDVFLGTLPLFHAFGLTVTTFMPLIEGIPVVCHPDPTDAYRVGCLAAEHRATFLCATPTFLGLYARNQKLHRLMFSSLRLVVAGAERLNDETRRAFKEKFGLEIHEGYGTTETTPVATVNTVDVLNTNGFSVQAARNRGRWACHCPEAPCAWWTPKLLRICPLGKPA